MSPDHNIPSNPLMTKDENQGSTGTRKTAPSIPPEHSLKCPRCDSPNTKFCYYNNYSLSQPRHFCKTCRRYWTKGGALRNVPIGGGCRKSKKVKSSSRFSSSDSKDSASSSSEISGLKFFQGLSPAMDFQLNGLSFPRVQIPSANSFYNQISSLRDTSPNNLPVSAPRPSYSPDPSGTSNSNMGFNYQLPNISSLNVQSNLASSIESLSSINQDLHWKLQQQRLAMLFGGDSTQKESGVSSVSVPLENQPILFQNLDVSKPYVPERKQGVIEDTATEWFFGNSYAAQVTATPTNSGGAGNDNPGNTWTGIQAWNDLHPYSALP